MALRKRKPYCPPRAIMTYDSKTDKYRADFLRNKITSSLVDIIFEEKFVIVPDKGYFSRIEFIGKIWKRSGIQVHVYKPSTTYLAFQRMMKMKQQRIMRVIQGRQGEERLVRREALT